jgi:hypothetical protein
VDIGIRIIIVIIIRSPTRRRQGPTFGKEDRGEEEAIIIMKNICTYNHFRKLGGGEIT